MRSGLIFAVILAGTTAAAAMQSQHGLPDIGTQYHHRQTCHGAYDLIVEEFKAGKTVSQADKDFVATYEANGEANKQCPVPSAEQPSGLATASSRPDPGSASSTSIAS